MRKYKPGSEAWKKRAVELLRAERKQPERWWYLSFATEKGFRGAMVIKAHGLTDAIRTAHALNINPGGEVMGVPVPAEKVPGEEWRERLLNKAEIMRIWPDA